MEHFKETLKHHYKNYTFQEAYERTGQQILYFSLPIFFHSLLKMFVWLLPYGKCILEAYFCLLYYNNFYKAGWIGKNRNSIYNKFVDILANSMT